MKLLYAWLSVSEHVDAFYSSDHLSNRTLRNFPSSTELIQATVEHRKIICFLLAKR